MSWIKLHTNLRAENLELIPMQEIHFHELVLLANDKRIWEFIPVDMSSEEKCLTAFSNTLVEREKGTQFPFVIVNKNKIIGSTRLMDVQYAHLKLEIGWTWMHPDYWASEVNLKCKLVLLTFCFEKLGAIRVQLKTDENNMRSRKAIEKIGALYEGTLRQDIIRGNGSRRNSCYFSILDSEWAAVKIKLASKIKNFK